MSMPHKCECGICGYSIGPFFQYTDNTETLRNALAQLNDISKAIGDNRYLDPPDGGSVTLAEQVQSMRVERDAALRELAAHAHEPNAEHWIQAIREIVPRPENGESWASYVYGRARELSTTAKESGG